MREKAKVAYQRAVQARIGKADTAATALTASSPFTGLLGVLGGAAVGGAASMAEREMEGEFTFGLGGLAMGALGLQTEAEFTQDFMEGKITVDEKGNVTRTDKGREAERAEGRTRGAGPEAVRGEAETGPAVVRAQAQRERPLAETPETEKITPEQVLNPPMFEEPQAEVPGVGAAGSVPSWLRRVRADVERARMTGGRAAFI